MTTKTNELPDPNEQQFIDREGKAISLPIFPSCDFNQVISAPSGAYLMGTMTNRHGHVLVQAHLRAAAFREWQHVLKRGDKLPRGKFFRGKQAVIPPVFIIDIGIC